MADVCIFKKTHCDLVGDFYHTPVPSPKLETKASAEIENISGTPLPGKFLIARNWCSGQQYGS